jgi:hypothetical protein
LDRVHSSRQYGFHIQIGFQLFIHYDCVQYTMRLLVCCARLARNNSAILLMQLVGVFELGLLQIRSCEAPLSQGIFRWFELFIRYVAKNFERVLQRECQFPGNR